jgi:uncharacterized protein YgiM (DUF1202 family)
MTGLHRLHWNTALRVVVSAALIVAGTDACTNGGNIFSAGADPSDSCGAEHAAFTDSKSFYLQEVAQGALFGALGGAALGALTAASTGGNAGTGALIGAGAGAFVGGTAGYFNARQKQAADQASLANSVYDDVSRASQEMDRATTTFARLRSCRFAAAEQAKSSFRQGTLTREQAAQQLSDHKRRFDDELALARQYGTKMAEQDQQYRFASDSLLKQDVEAQRLVSTRAVQFGDVAASGNYVATAAANVRSAPSGTAARVGTLVKGQAVQVPDEPASGEWRRIVLENGVTGFVSDRFLAPSNTPTAAPSTAPASPSVRTAQVAMATTETLPVKRAAYSKSVEEATTQSSLTFNLDQAA